MTSKTALNINVAAIPATVSKSKPTKGKITILRIWSGARALNRGLMQGDMGHWQSESGVEPPN